MSFSGEHDLLAAGCAWGGVIPIWHLPSSNRMTIHGLSIHSLYVPFAGPVAFLPRGKLVLKHGAEVPVRGPGVVAGDAAEGWVTVGGLYLLEVGRSAVFTIHRRLECPRGFHLLDVAVAPDEETLAIAYGSGPASLGAPDSGQVVLWNAWTGEEIRRLPTLAPDGLTFSRDGSLLAVARYSTVEIWDVAEGVRRGPMPDSVDNIVGIGFKDGDGALVAVDKIGIVSTYDVTTGSLLQRINWEHPIPLWNLGLFGLWLVLWLAADVQRRRTSSRPAGALDLGVYLLAAMSIMYVYAAVTLANLKYQGLIGIVAEATAFPFNVIGQVAFMVAALCLVGGLTRRFRSRLIFTVPSFVTGLALILYDKL